MISGGARYFVRLAKHKRKEAQLLALFWPQSGQASLGWLCSSEKNVNCN